MQPQVGTGTSIDRYVYVILRHLWVITNINRVAKLRIVVTICDIRFSCGSFQELFIRFVDALRLRQ